MKATTEPPRNCMNCNAAAFLLVWLCLASLKVILRFHHQFELAATQKAMPLAARWGNQIESSAMLVRSTKKPKPPTIAKRKNVCLKMRLMMAF